MNPSFVYCFTLNPFCRVLGASVEFPLLQKKKKKKSEPPPGISRDKDKMKIIQRKTTNSNPELKMSVLLLLGNIRQLSSNGQLVTVQMNSWFRHQFRRNGLTIVLRIDKNVTRTKPADV